MRTIATFVALVVMTLSLAGCIQVTAEPDAKPTSTTSAPADATSLSEEEYADVIRSEAPSLSEVDTAALVENATLVCESFDNGASFDELAYMFIDAGFNGDEAGTLIGGAIAWKCPEYMSELNNT